jgi:hypothetical protein
MELMLLYAIIIPLLIKGYVILQYNISATGYLFWKEIFICNNFIPRPFKN